MYFHQLKLALRNAKRNKVYTFINVLSLSAGIMFCLLIYLFVTQEFNHDKFHQNADRIYRLISYYSDPEGGTEYSALQDYRFVGALRESLPAVQETSALIKNNIWIKSDQKIFNQQVIFVDSSFFKIFSFQFLAGNPGTALYQINNIIITRKAAEKFFGPPKHSYNEFIGRLLIFPKGKEKNFVISGVIEDIPKTSSIQFDFVAPYVNQKPYPESNTFFGNSSIYLLVNNGADIPALEESATHLAENILAEKIELALKYFFDEDDDPFYEFQLQPLSDIYLNKEISNEYEASSSAEYSYILISIAFLVLVISCINYIMLTTGQSLQRTREVGMRKILGARGWQISNQFIGEAFLLSFVSLLISILLIQLILPIFNQLSQRNLSLNLFEPGFIVFVISLLFLISVVVGLAPSLRVNKLNPVTIFQHKLKFSSKSQFSRSFVIAQFSLSISLVIATIIILEQLNFLRERETGIDENKVMVVSIPDEFNDQLINLLRNRITSYAVIESAAGSDRNFIYGSSSRSIKNEKGDMFSARYLRIDPKYLETLGISLLEGRNFSETSSFDSTNAVLVNQAFVKEMGWDFPLGKQILDEEKGKDAPVVIGVVKDFHFDSMHKKIVPLVMHMDPGFNKIWNLFVKFDNQNTKQAVGAVIQSWKDIAPERPLNYTFLADSLDTQYNNEERWGKIVGYSAVFTLILSALGLLGLTLLIVTQRTKEIGIRKAIGASTGNILFLISKDFMAWVLISMIMATPVAYYVMQIWLRNFAYKISINWWIFIVAGVLAFFIALVTISIQTIKAALANPVEALRYE